MSTPLPFTPLTPPARRAGWRPVTLRRYWPALAIAVIAAVTAGVLASDGSDDLRPSVAGRAYDAPFAFDDDLATHSGTLRVPTGGVDVQVTDPQSSAPSGLNIEDRQAPDGGSLIGVRTTRNLKVQLPAPAVAEDVTPEVTVALVAGSRTYPIPPPFLRAGDDPLYRFAWVAVEGKPRDVRVAVTYDGVTQRVDPRTGTRTTGAAAPLYTLPTLTTTSKTAKACGTPVAITRGFRVEDDIRCEVQDLGSLPYLPGRGWAPKGTVWATALVGIFDHARFRRGATFLRAAGTASGPAITAAVPGSPAATLPKTTSATYLPLGAAGRLAAFAVPVGTTPVFTVVATYRDLESYGDADRDVALGPTVTVTWKVTS